MESKSFTNLSSTYKTFLSNLNNIDEFNVIDENSTLQQLNILYTIVDNLLKDQDLQIADINHMMENYTKQNDIIDKIKRISSLRNFLKLKMVMESSKWIIFIKEIKRDYSLSSNDSNKAVLELFKQYIGTWNTIDKFFIMNSNNTKLKQIIMIDPEDGEFLNNYS